ncbi:uncharacterized protein SPPG_02827 [Spizellomyces punctatus DAOM BR117]|uniref:Very-long-chain 3-oxoacyl-CoA reductase n=1 Tax=Spizellomyces punctatus (strain DAOM BR117) TaxID=645134 RepID=A0A0L0HMN0_SPIPD|nr:uncharacterized protein SPPG_02827 [Spizellomyces punctatus DAOM BR117]KND02357.1 hypothetical protein SPPG_02827 [Spizellomyces punctatus DAOM BR117]|eukprot:XP_016610396.1 hypothetical protein SPPG_02827 [Spizellomyces punctatus DAOM BR117]
MAASSCVSNYFLSRDLGHPNLATLCAFVGTLYLSKLAISFLCLLYRLILRPATNLRKYGAKKGAWAVVTGASDGIGKEFALQLGKAGFNVFLMARTKAKLDTVANEAKSKYGVDAVVYPFDFAAAGDAEYEALRKQFQTLEDVGVLVNNVAVNHEMPTPFAQESEALLSAIVEVDVAAQVRLTRMILPGMTTRKRGLILNVGSVAGLIPSAYLATYSGAKAFLRTWSRALAVECRPHNVHVEHVKTYFVTTAMSKIRRSTILAPTPRDYVRSVLQSAGKDTDAAPYPSHAVLTWVLEKLPEGLAIKKSADMHIDIRRRALKKREREAKKA